MSNSTNILLLEADTRTYWRISWISSGFPLPYPAHTLGAPSSASWKSNSPIICEQRQHKGWGNICNHNQHMNIFMAVILVVLVNHTAEILPHRWSSDKDTMIWEFMRLVPTLILVPSDWFMSSFHLLVENGSYSEADKGPMHSPTGLVSSLSDVLLIYYLFRFWSWFYPLITPDSSFKRDQKPKAYRMRIIRVTKAETKFSRKATKASETVRNPYLL